MILLIRVGDEWARADSFDGSIQESRVLICVGESELVPDELVQISRDKVKATGGSLLLYARHLLLYARHFLLQGGSPLLQRHDTLQKIAASVLFGFKRFFHLLDAT